MKEINRVSICIALFCLGVQAAPVKPIAVSPDSPWSLVASDRTVIKKDEIRFAIPGTVELRYPAGPLGARQVGFSRVNDSADDWSEYSGLRFDVYLPPDLPTTLDVRIVPHNAETVDEMISSRIQLSGKGWQQVSLPWSAFDYESARSVFLMNVSGLRIDAFVLNSSKALKARIKNLCVVKGDVVALKAPVRGKSVQAGETATYSVSVMNCTDAKQRVELGFIRYGWEASEASVEPASLKLEPYETAECTVSVKTGDRIPGGGHEKQILRAIANGRGDAAATIEFTTASELPHPYILHTAKRWDEVRQKVKDHAWAQASADAYRKQADAFAVPEPALVDPGDKFGPYVFPTETERGLKASAVAYHLTGEVTHAEKVRDFLLRLSDPEKGFPVTLRACHQSFVQEGSYFQNLAICYDMALPSGVFSESDQTQIEHTFRLFMKNVERENTLGAINNWNLAEVTGAFFCALAIQDLERADHFFSGPSGILDQFAKGVMDAGWWYECSISYNIWCSSEFTQAALAYEHFGVNFRDMWVPASYSDESLLSAPGGITQLSGGRIKKGANLNSLTRPFGMSKEIWGPITRPYRKITDMWNSLLPFLDYRSVMFAVNDATERKVGAEGFELAYFAYRDPAYAAIIKRSGDPRDLIYGVAELPEETPEMFRDSAHADNVGVAMLRSQAADRPIDEQIQAVLHYGTHGWAHGHYDRTGLLHLSRYGRSFFNPEMAWHGYPSFMYKFYVQSSIAKNMVVVDRKIQEANPGTLTLFHTGQLMQATAVETDSRWSYPPYGGMVYDYIPVDTFEEKIWQEGRYVPLPENPPEYGTLTEFTEPIKQRRLMVMADDYVLLADYVKGDQPHEYENLLQMKGFKGLAGTDVEFVRHDAQWDDDPINAAQFITDVDRYSATAPTKASFQMLFGPGADNAGTRTVGNTDGPLNFEVFSLWPKQQEIMIGTVPEDHGVKKQLFYTVSGDDAVLAEGKFGAWILGKADLDLPVEGVKTLKLETRIKVGDKPTVFWGDAHIVTQNGTRVNLADLPVTYENVKQPDGTDLDYFGGPVKIVGEQYKNNIPGQPTDKDATAVVSIDLSGIDAARFVATLGGDYPLGDETQRRKTMAVKAPKGKTARFLTVIEPHEGNPVVQSAEALDENTVRVVLTDGREQIIEIGNLESEDGQVQITMTEKKNGEVLRTESSATASTPYR